MVKGLIELTSEGIFFISNLLNAHTHIESVIYWDVTHNGGVMASTWVVKLKEHAGAQGTSIKTGNL